MIEIIIVACILLFIVGLMIDEPGISTIALMIGVFFLMFGSLFSPMFDILENNASDDIEVEILDMTQYEQRTTYKIEDTNIIKSNHSVTWNETVDYWKDIQRQRMEEW